MNTEQLFKQSKPLLTCLAVWNQRLLPPHLASVVDGQPERVSILSVGVIYGFCRHCLLVAPRVARIVALVASLFMRAHELGVHRFAILQDTHHTDTIDFSSSSCSLHWGTQRA